MTNNNSANVTAGKPKVTGAIFVAPAGTAIPEDAVTPLAVAFENLGYISEDGVANAIETDSENVVAWGGDTVLVTQTSYDETFVFTCIETNSAVLKEYYGSDNVTETDGNIAAQHTSEEPKEHPWIIETILKGGRVRREIIPNGKLSGRGEVTYVNNEPVGYEMTVSALPNEDNVTAYTHIATPVAP